jgi:hypothetical protein
LACFDVDPSAVSPGSWEASAGARTCHREDGEHGKTARMMLS